MKDTTIYYIVKKSPAVFNNTLPINLLEYIKNKRGNNSNDSIYAWNLLYKLAKVDLSKITFLESGKPILKDLSFSISHSNGYVAVAFTNEKINIGIDLEKITDKNLSFLSKLSTKFKGDTPTLFKLWTEHESTIKALNLNLLKNFDNKFKGVSKIIDTIDGIYSLSIYNDSNFNIKEITYED